MTDQTRRTRPKPVMALMGEFSAGKSTLANLLLGDSRSTVKVTATQMPPVWFTYGSGNPIVVDLDGNETEIAPHQIGDVSVADTLHVTVFAEAPILEMFDLIDMPGNSDPNMSSEVWSRAIHHADGVIWCTHANQAWRQSEAAVWEDLPDSLYDKSLLLLTRFDKILGDTNRMRVLRRVKAEAEGMFAGIYPISLTEALSAGDDRDKWIASGAEDFLNALLDLVMGRKPGMSEKAEPEAAPVAPRRQVMPRRVERPAGSDRAPAPDSDDGSPASRISAAE